MRHEDGFRGGRAGVGGWGGWRLLWALTPGARLTSQLVAQGDGSEPRTRRGALTGSLLSPIPSIAQVREWTSLKVAAAGHEAVPMVSWFFT